MAKNIYFVRHGQTFSNEANIIQGFDDELSPTGESQARELAERLSRIQFDALLSSDMRRTMQTAEIVAARTGHTINYSPLFREFQYPSSLVGISRSDQRVIKYWDLQKENLHDPRWIFEDEESVEAFAVRTRKAFALAAEYPVENVVVMTHGHFLRFLLATFFLGDESATRWGNQGMPVTTSNTGITHFAYTAYAPTGVTAEWKLATWNDSSHLG